MIATGIGYDVHRLVMARPLILGGVRIEHPLGLEGHSDADVLCHAIADALLGAAGEPDIGHMFPNTDPSIRGMSSLEILRKVRARLDELSVAPHENSTSALTPARSKNLRVIPTASVATRFPSRSFTVRIGEFSGTTSTQRVGFELALL